MNKCLILFVEGDTEVEFYKRVVANARRLHPANRFDTYIEYRNVKGVPPINWSEVEQELRKNGASQIIHVRAKQSIEDWFLYDTEGVMEFLRLGKNTKVIGRNGYDKLQNLYRRANKVYFKGVKSNDMIARLDIDKIVNSVRDQLKPLYDVLGVKGWV